jgi:glyoxylase-like metal-dependent hydrolase (beta-lactamase superfamily II)
MKVTQVTENLVTLTRFHFVNAHLVRETDGFTLIDTTLGGAAAGLIAAAARSGGAIRRIALTHGHGDHVGSLDALVARLPGIEVSMGELDAQIHAGEHPIEGKIAGSWPRITTVPTVRLSGGERIGSLEAIPSPGHSPGHIAFRDTRDGSLIAGDVFTAYGALAVSSHYRTRFPFAAMATWDRARDVESARALRALEPALLAVGHGPAVRTPQAAMDAAIARAAR